MFNIDKKKFIEDYKSKLIKRYSKDPSEATCQQQYLALGRLVRDYISDYWYETKKQSNAHKLKYIHYFSMEFLIGKMLDTSLINLGIRDICEEGLLELGISLCDLEKMEKEPGLGNGGLGRLAACFLDSMSSTGVMGYGQGIRYKYGLFKQKIENGYQREEPDDWLLTENIWEMRRDDEAVVVKFGGTVDVTYTNGEIQIAYHGNDNVRAVPYDMPVVGYDCKNVNTLRLWSAETVGEVLDFTSFSHGNYLKAMENKYKTEMISNVLYPDDANCNGKLLRLKQEYFFVSAGLQSIVNKHKKLGLLLSEFHQYNAVHINDTHPALCIPELMRILVDESNLAWDLAWEITVKTMGYTNHTIMSEALECWDAGMIRTVLPRIYMIIEEISRRFDASLVKHYGNDKETLSKMSIVHDGTIKMANLAIAGSHSVNGVAALHTKILKEQELKEFHAFFPGKFNNKTNGITHRRWLLSANRQLTDLICDAIGDSFLKNPNDLEKLMDFKDDVCFKNELERVRRAKKLEFIEFAKENGGIEPDADSMFLSQVKRMHAYKRQLLNVLQIMDLYNRILDDPSLDITPRTYVFAAKAFSSYTLAKRIIKLINAMAEKINSDPVAAGKIKVLFVDNYNVDKAEKIIPASDVSIQISTASKEASGTGNMKFMLNGAVTLATMDGANIEIFDAVGAENIITFGLSSDEVINYYKRGGYVSMDIFNKDDRINRIIGQLKSSFFGVDPIEFEEIVQHLLNHNDPYFVLRDFDSYIRANEEMERFYNDRQRWNRAGVINIAKAGRFSSDNTIKRYAEEIWKIKPFVIG